jgi:uncharacterized protein YndB with AHSA1/START domain
MNISHVPTPSGDRTLTLTRIFDAPRSLVFEAWTKNEHMDKWSAPHGFTIPISEGDLRPCGKWRCVMIAPDGSRHAVHGVYREVVLNELLVFTHIWEEGDGAPEHETVVTVRFSDEGDKTKMTLEQKTFRSVESRDGHEGGWSQGFEKLAELLKQLQSKDKL